MLFIQSVNVCMCVCVCARVCVCALRVEGKHSADTADFRQKEGKGRRGEKKKNRHSSKILMAE